MVVDRFFAALEAGEVSDVINCYASNACIWHNFDQAEVSPLENAAGIEQFMKMLPERKYTMAKRAVFDGGVVQQFVIVGVAQNGKSVEWPG